MHRALASSDPQGLVQPQASNGESEAHKLVGALYPTIRPCFPHQEQYQPCYASSAASLAQTLLVLGPGNLRQPPRRQQGLAWSWSNAGSMPRHSAMTRASEGGRDCRLCSRNWTCFAFLSALLASTGPRSWHTGCQHSPSFQRGAREHTRGRGWLQLTAPHCVQTRLGSSLQLQVTHGLVCHEFGQVSAPFPHRGTAVNRQAASSAWGRSSRAPCCAPGCPALRSRTLQHCRPAGFSRDASKERNQISREGSRHVPGCTEELSRQCQELGQLLGTAAQPEENRADKLPNLGCALLPLTPGAAAPLQTFVCKSCSREALP